MKYFAAVLALAASAVCDPTVYLIRHGEKPDDEGIGLSPQGVQRAQCLRSVFGAGSQYNIGHIMAQEYKASGKRKRPYDTVLPLANDLGLTVDVSCDRDDEKCVADVVDDYKGSGNILICWEHDALNNIAEEIGAHDVKNYPDDSFDLIWTQPPPYKDITDTTSENCPGLD
ncbi:uncharacterized protein F5Z01DRAFT_657806 [Emericellopsis atlantica]|uniref:Phosphoglycerate mutase family protein n=1 Tax=Emericellopsis atlantica TaxID=2614577 RepID=A0A9P8CNC2_9HYPO|nr:uncharacterized protein F5Z01DRAFT_657806 [Emericellopsis atlantica]KAG9253634.1 hypothetical protein F5Z01DRAFT_657806 [Emericellopsis atlantica]